MIAYHSTVASRVASLLRNRQHSFFVLSRRARCRERATPTDTKLLAFFNCTISSHDGVRNFSAAHTSDRNHAKKLIIHDQILYDLIRHLIILHFIVL